MIHVSQNRSDNTISGQKRVASSGGRCHNRTEEPRGVAGRSALTAERSLER